jgi:hypothetical protein
LRIFINKRKFYFIIVIVSEFNDLSLVINPGLVILLNEILVTKAKEKINEKTKNV